MQAFPSGNRNIKASERDWQGALNHSAKSLKSVKRAMVHPP
jgi:hypothetical protein